MNHAEKRKVTTLMQHTDTNRNKELSINILGIIDRKNDTNIHNER